MRVARSCAAILAFASLLASQAPSLKLGEASPRVVRLGGQVSMELTVSGASDAELLELPKVKDLRLQAFGPNNQVFQSFINGRATVTRSKSWRIAMQPSEAGDFEVPALRVRAGGKIYKTKVTRFACEASRTSTSFLEVAIEPARLAPGQTATMRIRFGVEPQQYERLQRTSRLENVRSFFLEFPSWDSFEGGTVDEDLVTELSRDQIAMQVNRGYRVARDLGIVKRGGERFRVLELRKKLRAERVGRFELPRAELRYRWVVRYGRDIFGDLVPAEVRDEFARSEPFAVEIAELPKEGRPKNFNGAVGSLELRGSITKSVVKVGESFSLELQMLGTAVSDTFDAPALDSLSGFHVFGKQDERGDRSLRVRYDVAAVTAGELELPAVEIAYYDPDETRYRVARVGPFKLRAAAVEGAKGLEALPDSKKALEPGVDDLWDRMDARGAAPERFRPSSALAWLALLLPLLLFLSGFAFVRVRARRAGDVEGRRRQGARRVFEQRIDAEGPLVALSHFVADRLSWEPGAVLGRDLEARLQAAGVSESRAREISELFARLEAGRYAGGNEEELVRDARSMVEALDRELRR